MLIGPQLSQFQRVYLLAVELMVPTTDATLAAKHANFRQDPYWKDHHFRS